MNTNQSRSWWSRQSFGAKLTWVVIALILLGLILSIPTYWDWIRG